MKSYSVALNVESPALSATAWVERLARYRRPSLPRGILELAVTLGPLALITALAWEAMRNHMWLGLLLIPLAAAFLTLTTRTGLSRARMANLTKPPGAEPAWI